MGTRNVTPTRAHHLHRILPRKRSGAAQCTSVSTKYFARGHGPNPAAVLICPASPRFTNALPKRCASSREPASGIHGSVSLPIRIDGTPRRRARTARRRRISPGSPARRTTRPPHRHIRRLLQRMRRRKAPEAMRGQHERPALAREQLAHRARPDREVRCIPVGLFDAHRAGNCRSSHVCQCAPSLPCRPGTVTSRGGHVDLLHESMIVLAAGIRAPIVNAGPRGREPIFLICLLDAPRRSLAAPRPHRTHRRPNVRLRKLRAISTEKVE